MNIAIVGYGRMGKEVDQICKERNHSVVLRIDPNAPEADAAQLDPRLLSGVDGVIEFSLAPSVLQNAKLYAAAGTSAVVGTTGWEAALPEVEEIIKMSGASYLHGSNFSLGAHIMFGLVAQVSRMIESIAEYDIMLHEFHHKNKADSPSGTAKTIAEVILKNLSRKTKIQTGALDRAIRPEELHVSSTRGGTIPGIHTVLIDSAADSVEITHTARSRRGFALGAVLAVEWLKGRKGFFRVEDFIRDILGTPA